MSTIRVVNIQHSDATEPNIVLEADGTTTFASGITISGGTNLTVSGTAEFASGTVSAPGITFIDDNNTGIYEPAADTVAITTAATERLRVDSSGRVGIGTTSPTQKVHIQDSSGPLLTFDDGTTQFGSLGSYNRLVGSGPIDTFLVSSTNGKSLVLRAPTSQTISFDIASSEAVRIDSSGRLLVGTSSASNNTGVLVVQGYAGVTAGEGTLDLVRGNNVTAAVQGLGSINFGHSQYQGASIDAVSEGAWTEGSSHPSRLVFSITADGASSPTERMRINNLGDVGVGTTAPTYYGGNFRTLEVAGSAGNDGGIFSTVTADNAVKAYFYTESTSDTATIGTVTNHPLLFRTNTVERMRIESSGNVNIGRNGNHTDTTARLSVFNSGASASWSVRPGTGVANQIDFINYNYGTATYLPTRSIADSWIWFDGDNGERMRIDSSGRLLAGTSSARSNFFNQIGVNSASIQIEGTGTSSSTLSIVSNNVSTTVEEPALVIGRSNGSAVGSNTVSSNGTPLGRISFQGNDGTNFVEAASIRSFVDSVSGADDMPGSLVFSTTADGASAPTEHMRITRQGRILCGTTTAYGRIHATGQGFNPEGISWLGAAFVGSASFGGGVALLDGTKGYSIYAKNSGDDFFIRGHTGLTSSATGGVQLNDRATSWTSASDERDKENLIPITNAVDKIKTLRTVTGNYYWAPETSCAFLIAQDVQQVLPEAVSIMDKEAEGDNQRLGLAYAQTIPLLTAALQEAIAKIETLEQRLSDAGIA